MVARESPWSSLTSDTLGNRSGWLLHKSIQNGQHYRTRALKSETALPLTWGSHLTFASLPGKPLGGPELLLSIAVFYIMLARRTQNRKLVNRGDFYILNFFSPVVSFSFFPFPTS